MKQMPSLFVSHGAPTYALHPGIAGPQLTAAMVRHLPKKPAAVLIVSPHWATTDTVVSVAPKQNALYDFSGFDPRLNQIRYEPVGHPELADRAAELLNGAGWKTDLSMDRTLDHGAWVPLRYMFPNADVPVFQVSMPQKLSSENAFEFGQALAPLSQHGVLVVGSGSLTHNLYEFRHEGVAEAQYALDFVKWVRQTIEQRDYKKLKATLKLAPYALRAHPTDEHFLPLLIALGASFPKEQTQPMQPATVLTGGMTYGILSMESYIFDVSAVVGE